MENTTPGPDEAAAQLAAAEASRDGFAGGLVLPPLFFASIGVAVSVQLATAAAGLARGGGQRPAVVAAGLLVFALVAGVQLARFRRRNGVWVAGLASRAVLGTAQVASLCYCGALAAALWAGFVGEWWLVAVCSLAGGAGYALGGRGWWRAYRGEPAAHSRAESAAVLAAGSALAVAGLVLLVLQR